MWDKEASKHDKNDDTPAVETPENSTTSCTKTNDLTKTTPVDSDTLVVATYVANEDDECADNNSVVDSHSVANTEPSDNNLLSIVRLCEDDPSATTQRLNELNQSQTSACATNITPRPPTPPTINSSPLPPAAAITATSAINKEVNSNSSALTVNTDADELPYTNTNANLKTQTSQQSQKPTISVKYFSPILRVQTVQNETSLSPTISEAAERRSENLQSDNVAGPQIQSSNNNVASPSPAEQETAVRVLTPVDAIEDLMSVSDTRAVSPANSSVTSVSTFRVVRSTSSRRGACMRHMRRAPKEPDEYMDALFPHIRDAHYQIRHALLHAPLTDVKDNALLKRKMFEVIRLYISGCKNEFERVGTSLILCRRLKRNILRLLDLFHDICSSNREDRTYLYHISQLIAVYNSLEIRLSFNLTRLQKCALIHRIAHVIHKHLAVKDESLAKENILRMFLRMPDMYSARFIMEPLFNTFLTEIPTSNNIWSQRELPDKTFVQYIIILHLWKEMLRDPLEQVELINRAQHFMCPTKTLHTNPMYANHLPTIHTRKHAVKDILNSLKYFHDLKNAAICDDTLLNGDDDIEVVIDDVINTTPFWDFGSTYAAETKYQRHINRRVVTPEPAECVDLTIEDEQEPSIEHVENPLVWLTDLKERASKRVHTNDTEKVICLDSDSDGELFSGSILDPTESYQDCDAVDTDYTSLDGSTADEKDASEDELLPTSGITPNGLRTYLAPKSKKQNNSSEDMRTSTSRLTLHGDCSYARTRDDYDESEVEGDSVAVGTKTPSTWRVRHSEGKLPLIVNTFSVSGKQNMHMFNSSRFSLDIGPERFGNDDMEFQGTCDDEHELRRRVMQERSRRIGGNKDCLNADEEQNNDYYEREDDNDEEEYHSLPSASSSSTSNLGKVIYSQALLPQNRRFPSEDDADEEGYNRGESVGKSGNAEEYIRHSMGGPKQGKHVEDKPVKKQVKFNDNPIGPTRRSNTKVPIKPAIHLSKMQNNNQQPICTSSPQPRFASPSSSTSSTTESLKQMAQKEHINAIATLFSSYKITKPPIANSAAARSSDTNTPLVGNTTISTQTSRPHRSATISPQTVTSPRSAQRNNSTSPVSERTNSPIITSAEIAADPKLHKKCAVVLQENDEVVKYKKQEIAFINDLLEKQREMQRQRALKRQQFQNILKQKREEGKRLMAEIAEIKRQRAEVQGKAVLAPEVQGEHLSPITLNRKRLLVKERKMKLKTKTLARSRSVTPDRIASVQNEDETIENEIETAARQTTAADAEYSLATTKNISTMKAKGDKSATETRVPVGMENELDKVKVKSSKARAQSPRMLQIGTTTSKANSASEDIEMEMSTGNRTTEKPTRVLGAASKTLKTDDLAKIGITVGEKLKSKIEVSSKASLSEKPKIPLLRSLTEKTRKPSIASSSENTKMPMGTSLTERTEIPLATSLSEKLKIPLVTSFSERPKMPLVTSLSEKLEIPSVTEKTQTTSRTRYARSMTPTLHKSTNKAVILPTQIVSNKSNKETARENWLLKSSFSFSSPTSSKTDLMRAPSLSPSIFISRNRVEVRRSMKDPSSSTDFPSSNTSWLLNSTTPQTLTKTVKVRLKRLQHLNINSSSQSGSPEKNYSDKLSMLRPASTIPICQSENETNEIQTIANKNKEESAVLGLQLQPERMERIQKLKQRLKTQLLEMDKKYGASVKKVIENVLINTPKELISNAPSPAVEAPAKKAIRRKPQRKQTHLSKKLKLSDKVVVPSEKKESKTKRDNTINVDANLNVEDTSQCDINKHPNDDKTVSTISAGENKSVTESSCTSLKAEGEITEEGGGDYRREICGEQRKISEEQPSKNDECAPAIEATTNLPNQTITNIAPMDIGGSNIIDKQFKGKHTHGAIVTQVVDVTPGRHVKDGLLSDLLLVKVKTAPKTLVPKSNEPVVVTENTGTKAAKATDFATAEQVPERCPASVLPATANSPHSLKVMLDRTHVEISNEMAAAAASLTMLANTTTKIQPTIPTKTLNVISHELQNENGDSLLATGIILPKRPSCDSFSSNIHIVTDPPTVIGLQNDAHSRSITPMEGVTTQNTKPLVTETVDDFVRLQNTTSTTSDEEESSSDCLLSHLSKRVHKISDLESIVDATTVHVIKDAAMTLMSFEATPTLPTYLLNGESRDVPTPPAISTPASTTQSIPTADLTPATPTTSALLESAKNELSPTPMAPQDTKATMSSTELPKPNSPATVTASAKESEQIADMDLPSVPGPTLVEQELAKFSEQIPYESLTPTLKYEEQFENTINSPAPANAISTSDHEVSSTQELVCTSTKRSNSNTLNKAADMSTATLVEETAMVVQNSQIDTTHHLPDTSYYMRRRARKFSDEFTLRVNNSDNPVTKVTRKQRRKTFSSESSLHVQFASNTLLTTTTTDNTLTSSSATMSGTSITLNSGAGSVGIDGISGIGGGGDGDGGGGGGSSPSTTTEPMTKQTATRRRNHTQKRNNSQSPKSARSRGGGELNSTFVFGCSRLQSSKIDPTNAERCVVLPASAVVPPVNLGSLGRTYTKNSMTQIKVYVPPEVEMCMENEDMEKDVTKKSSKISGTEATTTSRRGRPPGSVNRNTKKPKLVESAEKIKARKTAVNMTTAQTGRVINKRGNKNNRPNLQDSKSAQPPKQTTSARPTPPPKATPPPKPTPVPATVRAPSRIKSGDRVSNRKRK